MTARSHRVIAEGRSVKTRLRQLVLLLGALLLVVCVTAVGSLQMQASEINRLTLAIGPAFDTNNQVLQAMVDAETGLLGYQVSRDPALLPSYVAARARATAALATVRSQLLLSARDEAEVARYERLEVRQRVAAQRWVTYAQSAEKSVIARGRIDAEQGIALFASFRGANAALGAHLKTMRDAARIAARTTSARGAVASIAATMAALVAALVLGRRAADSLSRPLTELRDTMTRQRAGDASARARVNQGASEVRSLAEDFNALTEQNVGLQQIQALSLKLNELTFDIARAIRSSSGTQQALDVLCSALGKGLEVDRVMANTVDADHKVQLGAQWHREDLSPLGDIPEDLTPYVGQLADELWRSSERLTLDDLLAPGLSSPERAQAFQRETGARALMIVPIGLGEQVIGMIYVVMVRRPRGWIDVEANAVQQVAGFVARAIVEAGHKAQQSDYVERLVGLDRQKTDFLATVSHELRTPLTSISGYLEMLQDRDAGELTADQARMLEVMDRNTNRLGGLIEDLLVLNRIESGDGKFDAAAVSMRELIAHAGQELSPFALRCGITLDIGAGPEAAVVHGDRGSLDRAIINIVSNAIKFSSVGGVVTVRCMLDASYGRVLISCQDRGIGIPAEDQRHLFTRFYRASNATARAIPGTGLGLSIVKQIVEEHGGELRLSSIEGDGTEVVIDLPRTTVAPVPSRAGNDSQAGVVFGLRA